MHFCLFDIDGTLLNSGGAGQAAMEAALKTMFGAHDPVHGISTAGRTDRAIVTDLFSFFEIDFSEAVWNEFLEAYLKELPTHLATRDGSVLPGVVEILEALDVREDVVLGLLTGNFARGAQAKLSHFQIDHYFPFGGFGDVHHHRNDVAREAVKMLKEYHPDPFHPDQVWVIGDTPADVECGRAIGAKVIAVATGLYSGEELQAAAPDFLFADFSNPKELLALFS